MQISLLFSGEAQTHQKVPSQLYELIHFDTQLGERVRQVLSLPASAADIHLRQTIFQRMENEVFFTDLRAFYSALTALWQATNKLKDAQNECEELLGFYACACRYVTACESAHAVSGEFTGNALKDFCDFCDKSFQVSQKLTSRIGCLDAHLKNIRTSLAVFQQSGIYLRDDEDKRGLLTEIRGEAAALGFHIGDLPEQRCIAMPHELSEALMYQYPDEFEQIRALVRDFAPLETASFLALREELNFYFNVFELVEKATLRGIPHCLPKIGNAPIFSAVNAYDITLLDKAETDIIPNDIDFNTDEPFAFLTGANGGGKTTYLRTVCANLILASAGCPMFATEGTVSSFNFIGAHFPVDEIEASGRLNAEQVRADALLELAKDGGFLFFNETFSGANDRKGVLLTLDCAEKCVERGVFALYVTHFHEVSAHRFPILSTLVEQDNANKRTYKIAKNPGVKSSYAEDILRKYLLSADTLHLRGGNDQ